MWDWLTLTEYVFGAVNTGKISPSRVRPDIFHPPYNLGIPVIGDKNAVVKEIGFDALQAAHDAVTSLNGAGAREATIPCSYCSSPVKIYEKCSKCGADPQDIDWVKLLEEAHANYVSSKELYKVATRLEKNEQVDLDTIRNVIEKNLQSKGTTFTDLEDIIEEELEWKTSGIKFLDNWNGGYPTVGVVNVAGRPKVGKTTLVLGMVYGYVREHPDEVVAVFTLEMTASQFKKRFMQLYPDSTVEERRRIKVTPMISSAHEAINKSAAVEKLGAVFIDFADLMMSGEVTEQQTTSLYRTLANGSKNLGVPVILISQLSGSYMGGVPRPFHVRYSRLIEALVVMNLMLYVPWNDWFELKDDDILPVIDGNGYVIRWFSRFPTAQHSGLPGAILVPFDGKTGWDLNDPGKWKSLEKLA